MSSTSETVAQTVLIILCASTGFLSCATKEITNIDKTLTPEQTEKLEKFKELVKPQLLQDYMKDDFFLRRWLEAKDWKLSDAEAMLSKSLQWRKQNQMDTIHDEDWSDMKKDFPYQTDTLDKQGRSVGTLSAKKWDIRRAVNQGKISRLQRYMYNMLDELTMKVFESRKLGNNNVTQWSAIINADGFGLLKHACPSCVPIWMNFAKSASDHYPGYVESITLINVPRTLVRIIRPIFASNTLKIYGSNDKDGWMKHLDEKIEKVQRRQEYGGYRKD